jgi:ubiquitin-protein ligase
VPTLLDLDPCYKPEQINSVYSLFGELERSAALFLQIAKSDENMATEKSATETQGAIAKELAGLIVSSYDIVNSRILNSNYYKTKLKYDIKDITKMPIAEAYKYLMHKQRFNYISMKKPDGTYSHHWNSMFKGKYSPQPSKMIRLAQEIADLNSSLPIDYTNSMFVRADEERIDVMKVMIFGAEGTPYASGGFEYHVYFDHDYPNSAPKVNLETTGQGDVRFNPNLYSCGKVCLSLLGTWRGNASENWDPKLSNL